MTFAKVAASSSPSATRTTTTEATPCAKIPVRASGSVPVSPRLVIWETFVTCAVLFRGKAIALGAGGRPHDSDDGGLNVAQRPRSGRDLLYLKAM